MKKYALNLVIYSFLLQLGLQASHGNILFVHLGDAIPPCLITTLKQARYLNTDSDI